MLLALKRNSLVLISFGLILVATYFYIYPEVSSHYSRWLNVSSSSNNVRGIYYPLSLDKIDSVFLESGYLKVVGSSEPWNRVFGKREIVRSLPKEFRGINIRDSVWKQSGAFEGMIVSGELIGQYSTFMNMQNGDRIRFGLPFDYWYLNSRSYHGKGDSVLIVFASAKRGDNTKSCVGYIIVAHGKY